MVQGPGREPGAFAYLRFRCESASGHTGPRGYPTRVRSLAVASLSFFIAACTTPTRDLLERPFDAGSETSSDASSPLADTGPDADPTLGGPCVDDGQCDDHIACTYDACDQMLHRCRYRADDTQCSDGVYCDGVERCGLQHGCEPGPVVTCEDGDPCTIDRCVEATKSCTNVPRDLDGDGDPDGRCFPKHDCNDLDPTVASTHSEVCANGKDDNCNGLVDEKDR